MQNTTTVPPIKSSELFITGCDDTTSWMMPWFLANFRKYNPRAALLVYNFGMPEIEFEEMWVDFRKVKDKGWYKKPKAMQDALKYGDKVVWLDTDCEVRANLDSIFDYITPNTLAMGEDTPWTTRSGQRWHNTGVVGFQGPICEPLDKWVQETTTWMQTPTSGDQQVLHSILLRGMNRLLYTRTIPKKYNCLRLDVLDKTDVPNPAIMHWTGPKGKQTIKGMMNG